MNYATARLCFQVFLIGLSPVICGAWSRHESEIVQGRGGISTVWEALAVFGPYAILAIVESATAWWMARSHNQAVNAALRMQPPDPVPLTDTQPYRVVTPDGGVSVSVSGDVSPELLKRIRELLSFAAGGGK